MARTATFKNNVTVANELKAIDAGTSTLSRHLTFQLIRRGLVTQETVKVENAGRGRPAKQFVLTGKGRGFVALSKNWKVKEAE